eukprot:2896121-Rhodomonas_salina.1
MEGRRDGGTEGRRDGGSVDDVREDKDVVTAVPVQNEVSEIGAGEAGEGAMDNLFQVTCCTGA